MMNQWPVLYRLWKRTCLPNSSKQECINIEVSWAIELPCLYELGIGMEETMRYLYYEKPTSQEFKIWLDKTKVTVTKDKSINSSVIENDVLSKEDLLFWEKNGYVVIRNVISKQQCINTQKAICDFLNIKIDEPYSWYKSHEEKRGLMVSFTHHPTLDANRESLIIKKAYEQLYRTTEIYKTIDKVSFNPPETIEFHFLGSKLHWDVSLELPIPFSLQGMLYLTDCNETDGAFHCVPGFHNKIDSWINELPKDVYPRDEALKTLTSKPVIGKAGDFIIWHQAIPHCATPNHGKTPRMVQYLTYLPKQVEMQNEWI